MCMIMSNLSGIRPLPALDNGTTSMFMTNQMKIPYASPLPNGHRAMTVVLAHTRNMNALNIPMIRK